MMISWRLASSDFSYLSSLSPESTVDHFLYGENGQLWIRTTHTRYMQDLSHDPEISHDFLKIGFFRIFISLFVVSRVHSWPYFVWGKWSTVDPGRTCDIYETYDICIRVKWWFLKHWLLQISHILSRSWAIHYMSSCSIFGADSSLSQHLHRTSGTSVKYGLTHRLVNRHHHSPQGIGWLSQEINQRVSGLYRPIFRLSKGVPENMNVSLEWLGPSGLILWLSDRSH